MGRGSSKVAGASGGNAGGRDFTANSAENFLNVKPVTGFSNYTEKKEALQENLQAALDNGYEIIPRDYTRRGNSGQLYDFTENEIETPVRTTRDGMLSANSNLVKHARDVQSRYDDVIVLQVEPVTPTTSVRRGGGFRQSTPTARYVVLARRAK